MQQVSPVALPYPARRVHQDVGGLPAGPRLPSWLASLCYVADTYRFYAALRRRYGDTFTLHSATGPLVVTGDPALARDVFTAPPETFRVWASAALAPFLGERSLLLSHGDRHRRDRKLLTPRFTGAACARTAS